jgi:hypothetical protein
MKYEIVTESKLVFKFVDALMPSMISQLKLEPNKKSVVILIEKSPGEPGLTIPLNIDEGVLLVVLDLNQTLRELALSLAHEMVHVRQFAKGMLTMSKSGIFTWMGRKMPRRTPYLDQPWEIDAFSKQELLMRRAIEL